MEERKEEKTEEKSEKTDRWKGIWEKTAMLLMICEAIIILLFCFQWVRTRQSVEEHMATWGAHEQALTEELGETQEKVEQLKEQLTAKDQEIEKLKKEKDTEKTAMIGPPAKAELSIDTLEIGEAVDPSQVKDGENDFFKAYEITEGDAVYSRINGKSYYDNENLGLADLRYLKMIHYNFDHQVQVGEMIVNAAISEDVLNIFRELYEAEYEIASMRLIDDYWTGDGGSSDSNSIDHNNTSAFCYRPITGGGKLSNHAYGRAIDLNPQQNPYVWNSGGQLQWSHENASAYVDRTSGDPHVIVQNDVCYNIFAKYGFSWGGLWSDPTDYQHFEKES